MSAARAAVVVGGGSGIGAAVGIEIPRLGHPGADVGHSAGDVTCDISIPDQCASCGVRESSSSSGRLALSR